MFSSPFKYNRKKTGNTIFKPKEFPKGRKALKKSKAPVPASLDACIGIIKEKFEGSFDLLVRKCKIQSADGAFVLLDGMCDELKLIQSVITPLTEKHIFTEPGESLPSKIKNVFFKGSGITEKNTMDDALSDILSGCAVLFIDGETSALSFSVQGYVKKSVSEPQTEQNERGSREGFTDNFKDNATLLRRRLRTSDLVIEQIKVGSLSDTPLLFCYLKSKADAALVEKIKKRIDKIPLETVLGAGYIRPFLDKKNFSMFSDTGLTERPDTFASMLCEGRIGIITDGTPFAIIVPYLLADYFHVPDDYLTPVYYATFMRCLRIFCFIIAAILPGLFVALCLFHPEVMPSDIMYEIASAENKTPFPVATEAIIIHLIYEIVREAGLRMPVAIGHAVSIVGALVIGDAAVTAGLIAAPMLIVVALTAISSSVVSRLHETVAVMRFGFIVIGGLTGLYGIMIGLGLMILDMSSVSPYGIPFTVPFSPFVRSAQKDNLLRKSWRRMGKSVINIDEMRV